MKMSRTRLLLRQVLLAVGLAVAFAGGFGWDSGPAEAALQIRIEQGVTEPLPIAIPDFVGATPAAQATGRDLANVIRADLERSGLFRPLNPASFVERITDINVPPRFGDWRTIQA